MLKWKRMKILFQNKRQLIFPAPEVLYESKKNCNLTYVSSSSVLNDLSLYLFSTISISNDIINLPKFFYLCVVLKIYCNTQQDVTPSAEL